MSFFFSDNNKKKIEDILAKYPSDKSRSAILPLLHLAQEQNNNYLSVDCLIEISKLLKTPIMRVYEVATFYSMFNLEPVGKYLIQICRTTSCLIAGYKEIVNYCKKELNINADKSTTKDDLFSLVEVECLGACCNAPVMQINNDYYENLTLEKFKQIISAYRKNDWNLLESLRSQHKQPGVI